MCEEDREALHYASTSILVGKLLEPVMGSAINEHAFMGMFRELIGNTGTSSKLRSFPLRDILNEEGMRRAKSNLENERWNGTEGPAFGDLFHLLCSSYRMLPVAIKR